MVSAGILPFRENSHGRAGNRTRGLMISSQILWPLDHEAGLITVIEVSNWNDDEKTERCVRGLIIVSKEKHTFVLPGGGETLKPLLADPSEPKVRCHINYTYRDVKELRRSSG